MCACLSFTYTHIMSNGWADFGPVCESQRCDLSGRGRENRHEQRAGLLQRDRITEWLKTHDCKSAKARLGSGVKTCLCNLPQVSGRLNCTGPLADTRLSIHWGQNSKTGSSMTCILIFFIQLWVTFDHLGPSNIHELPVKSTVWK